MRSLVCSLVFLFSSQVISEESINQELAQKTLDYKAEKKIDQLLLLIQKRLDIMHEVARTKWNQNLPIEDSVREKQSLIGLTEQARNHGLDEKWTSRFFQAQFDLAKDIQRGDFALWKVQGVLQFEFVLDLKSELRCYIDQVNQEMIVLLSEIHEEDRESVGGFLFGS